MPIFPEEVQQTTDALSDIGVSYYLAAMHLAIDDAEWVRPVESALGPLRFALAVSPTDHSKAVAVADRFNFPGPITTSISQELFSSGLVRVSPGAPGWVLDWITQMKIHSDGHRTDAFGTWVSKVDELALGGAAARAQLLAAQSRLAEITEELPEIEIIRGRTSARKEELEGRIRQQERRTQ